MMMIMINSVDLHKASTLSPNHGQDSFRSGLLEELSSGLDIFSVPWKRENLVSILFKNVNGLKQVEYISTIKN